ncbi:MAG: spore coat U domain-containing protein [Aphanizomenon gracile PMC644.10]|nr:spore coat U domain-containing protein [Aphanizomenon gracile PMC644.10]
MSRLSSRSLLLTAAVSSLALGGTLWVKPALAGTATSNITVGANVPASCTISSQPINFGAYDAGTGSPISTFLDVNCTTGASAVITLSQGSNAATDSTDAAPLRRMKLTTGNRYLSYNLYHDNGHSTVWGNTASSGKDYTGVGNAQALTFYAKMTLGLSSAAAGSYSDTVVATITY